MSNDMRIGGLASGMDTDQIIKDLMKAERIPLDKLEQKKQYLEWQRDDYRDMNKAMFDFSNLIFDGVMKHTTYSQKTIETSDPNAASIRNINSTSDFNGTLKIDQLASSATMFSANSVFTSGFDPAANLSDAGVTGTQSITIKAIKPDGTIETNGYTLSFDPTTESLNSVMSKINASSNVTMFYDSFTRKVSVTAKNSGDVSGGDEIQLSGSFLTTNLGLDTTNTIAADPDGNPGTNDGRGSLGMNAKFSYNGLSTERTTNTFQLNGFEVSLKEADPTKTITFSSIPDTEKILDKIVKFVDEYNKLIEKVNDELNEKKYRDFQPLTSTQKEGMAEKEIELWEEKSHSGTLRNDSVLSSGVNKMRVDLYSTVSGGTSSTNQLAQIGIKTSSNYLDNGKLVIDESKLKEAISKDPNGIYELFAKSGTTSNEQGLGRRLRETLKDTMGSIEKKAGKYSSANNTFSIGRLLTNMDSQIDRFQDRMVQVENRYWRQFTAMEKAIQQSNQQSMFLMNQFGGGM